MARIPASNLDRAFAPAAAVPASVSAPSPSVLSSASATGSPQSASTAPAEARSFSAAAVNKVLSSMLIEREAFAERAGMQFPNRTGSWQRSLYNALGYPSKITFADYRARYERGGIAARLVDAYPNATWAHGAYIAEQKEPTETPFEKAVNTLFDALDMWEWLNRVDILAGIGRYAVLFIGAPGDLATPLPKLPLFNPSPATSDDAAQLVADLPVAYIAAFDESCAEVGSVVTDPKDRRYGLPLTYKIKISTSSIEGLPAPKIAQSTTVHWTRVIHVADGRLDSGIFGTPRLRPTWNYINDLEKIIGGGSEAAWKRMDPGTQIDMQPDIELTTEEEEQLSNELDELHHGFRRWVRTRGAKITPLTMPVAAFGANATAVLRLISGAAAIPQRLLLGSERGELASTQDRDNWSDRIDERRARFAVPLVRELIERLIQHEALPRPTVARPFIIWPRMEEQTEGDKATMLGKLAAANLAQSQAGGGLILSGEEMRDMVYGLDPAPELEDISSQTTAPPPTPVAPGGAGAGAGASAKPKPKGPAKKKAKTG